MNGCPRDEDGAVFPARDLPLVPKKEMKQFIHIPCSVRVVSHVPRPHNKVTADVVYYRFRTNQLTTKRTYKYKILKKGRTACTVLNEN